MPSVELVIGLVGSTIGIAICIVFPACCFTKVSKKESTEMLLARFMIVCGLCLMVLGTYANLRAIDGTTTAVHVVPEKNLPEINVYDLPPVIKTNDNDDVAPELEKLEYKADSPAKEGLEKSVQGAVNEVIAELHKDLSKVESKKEEEEDKNAADEKDKKEKDEEEAQKKPLNNDAIKKEDDELKADKESKVVIQEELNAVVDEIKRQNEESQKKVLEKLEEIVERIEHKHEPAVDPSAAALLKEPAIDQNVVEQVRDKFPDPIPLRAVNNNVIDPVNRSGVEDKPQVDKVEEKKVIETANDIDSNLIGNKPVEPGKKEKSIADLQKAAAAESQEEPKAVQKDSDNNVDEKEAEKKSENEDVEAIRRDLLNVVDENLARLKRSSQDCEKEI